MSTPNILRHLHLPSITPFNHAQTIQTRLVTALLSHKALLSLPSPPSHPVPPPPLPTLLSFTPTPVYTTGRRELNTLTITQTDLLTAPLPSLTHPHDPTDSQHAQITPTLRGGQITFHGPGQLVLYPILDLKAVRSPSYPRGLTARCYVHLLEETTIRTLAHCGVEGGRTGNPGVWVDDDTKIAALGVHLRRGVASYGVGLNLGTDLRWFERIVGCGLVGKGTTNLEVELGNGNGKWEDEGDVVGGVDIERVAGVWAREFGLGLWGTEGIVRAMMAEERDVLLEGLVGQRGWGDGKVDWKTSEGVD